MTKEDVTEVKELLDALSNGRMSLDEVAQRFRERTWIRRKRQEYSSYEDKLASHLQDSDPPLQGSFADVSAALHRNQITLDQYRVLSEAAAEAMKAQDAASAE